MAKLLIAKRETLVGQKFRSWVEIQSTYGVGEAYVHNLRTHCLPLEHNEIPDVWPTVDATPPGTSSTPVGVQTHPGDKTPVQSTARTRAAAVIVQTPSTASESPGFKSPTRHEVLMADYKGIKVNPFFGRFQKDFPGLQSKEPIVEDVPVCSDHECSCHETECPDLVDSSSSEGEDAVPDEKHRYHVKLATSPKFVLITKKSRAPGQLWFDTGCRRCVAGPEDHLKIRAELAKIGLKPMVINKQEEFIFGDAKTATSDLAFVYPSFQNGKFSGVMDMARVPVPCPGLFSLDLAKLWECITDHANEQLVVQKYKRVWPFEHGTPYLNMLDFTPETLDLTGVPSDFFLTPP